MPRPPNPGRCLGLTARELRSRLDALARRYDARFLHTDPLGMVRRFSRPEDRQLVGFLASGLAYGRAEGIRSSLDRLLRILGPRPSRFLESFEPSRDTHRFESFVHRFTRGRDVALLLSLLRQAIEGSGSLENFFLEGDREPEAETLEQAMDSFALRLFRQDARPFYPDGVVPRSSGARWLLPRPAEGSVCKRHCLFLRWMIRPEDGLDCGVWSRPSPARLVLPMDTHLQRLARALGWTRRCSPSWRMALEVTSCLRRLDPYDPTRYDFALSRLGILGRLRSQGGRLRTRQVLEAFESLPPMGVAG